jgi:hypothetical protein
MQSVKTQLFKVQWNSPLQKSKQLMDTFYLVTSGVQILNQYLIAVPFNNTT